MIKIERTGIFNMENAVRGARNAMNSWGNMDSRTEPDGTFVFGNADLELMTKLCAAGSSHRKFMRQIFVSADITAPLYWWKEYDTYKVGTTANSQSTMHKLHAKPITPADFSHDKLRGASLDAILALIEVMESLRLEYIKTKDKSLWYALIQLLPSSYRQMRTCTMSYENLVSMRRDRLGHKLEEWRVFCEWIESLPYANPLIFKPEP
ncbi:MAG: hypothetical protein FWE91_02050 [Defluviitaleaceae bacterium]|nr:hypothetical protein [Defluviitaleaceae bacterium]MCL2836091.1 hypothetical protein [Defluviitaleaceae bacterium]